MKNIVKAFFLFFLLISGSLVAQSKLDKIKKINGEEIEVDISKTDQKMVYFTYAGETETYKMSKRMIQEITHKNGRKEKISEEIVIKGEADWEKVMITQDKDDVEGLVKKGEAKEGTKGISINSASASDKKATKKLRQEAAKMGGYIVYVVEKKETNASSSGTNSVTNATDQTVSNKTSNKYGVSTPKIGSVNNKQTTIEAWIYGF